MEFRVLNKWDASGVEMTDLGLKRYINLGNRLTPNSFGRAATKQFGKSNQHVIERIATKLMVSGHLKDNRTHKRISGRDTGKKQKTVIKVIKALEIIEQKTKENPFQTLIKAVENAAPREETTRIRQGGIIAHRAIDISPQRRLDLALRFLSHGAGQKTFKSKQTLEKALADEILAAAKYDLKCYTISKKEELERVASSAR